MSKLKGKYLTAEFVDFLVSKRWLLIATNDSGDSEGGVSRALARRVLEASGGVGSGKTRDVRTLSSLAWEIGLEFIEKIASFLDEPGNQIYKGRVASLDELEGAQRKLGVPGRRGVYRLGQLSLELNR